MGPPGEVSAHGALTVSITLRQSDFGDGDAQQVINGVTGSLTGQPGVHRVEVTPAPQTQKGLLPADLGQLLVDIELDLLTTAASSALVAVLSVLIGWSRRRSGRTGTAQLNGRQVSVKGDSDPVDLATYLLEGAQPPDRPPAKPQHGRYALLITTSNYEDATLRALHGPETDGRLLAYVLEDPDVGGYQRVQQLHNPAARAAVRAVKEFFRERSPGELALIYFSGHGLQKDGELFFAAADTDTAELPATTLPAKLIADEAANSRCDQVVVILDCCYGGAFPPGHRQHTSEQVQTTLSPMVSRHDFVLISATGATEFALDVQSGNELQGTDARHRPSLFTKMIIDGLESGDADENGDGEVTAQELFNYLNNQLEEHHPQAQTPIFEERRRGSVVIARSRQVHATRAIPARIRKTLAEPGTFSTGLQDLLRHDERGHGGQRDAVVKMLMSSYTTQDAGDPAIRDEVARALATLAQRPVTRNGGVPRRHRPRGLRRPLAVGAVSALLAVAALGAAGWLALRPSAPPAGDTVAGEITIAGSATVEPVTRRVAAEFTSRQPRTHTNIAGAGTGIGFDRFCIQQSVADGIDLVGASRPITTDEDATCQRNSIRYERFLIGHDGMSIVVSTENDFLTWLTYDQLRAVFQGNRRPSLKSWKEVNSGFPDRPIVTCAPDEGSGTFDYFVDEVFGGDKTAFRTDGVRSADGNDLVQCVQTDKFAIGFFGHGFYQENAAKLKLLMVAENDDVQPELPTEETVLADLYPFSRPLFVYARLDSIVTKPQIAEFLRFLLGNIEGMIREVGYFPTHRQVYSGQLARLDELIGPSETDDPH